MCFKSTRAESVVTYFCSYLEHRIWRCCGYKAHLQRRILPVAQRQVCVYHLIHHWIFSCSHEWRYWVFDLVTDNLSVVCATQQICIKETCFSSKSNVWVCALGTAVIPKRAAAHKDKHPVLPSWHSKAVRFHHRMHLSHQRPGTQTSRRLQRAGLIFPTDILHGRCFSATVLRSSTQDNLLICWSYIFKHMMCLSGELGESYLLYV